MDQKAMLDVHSGSIYRAFYDLGGRLDSSGELGSRAELG